MKKLLLILTLTVSLAGCAWISKQVDYQKLCQQDPICLAQAKGDAELARTVVGAAYPVAAGAAGAVVMILSLWLRGRKKEPK